MTVELTVGKALEISKLLNPAFLVNLGGNHADAAQNGVFSEARDQEVHVTYAVQHRKNHGLGSHRSTEIVHGTGKSVALNAQQDYVIGSGDAVSGNGFRMYRQISMWADDLESFRVYLFRSLGANETAKPFTAEGVAYLGNQRESLGRLAKTGSQGLAKHTLFSAANSLVEDPRRGRIPFRYP